MDGKKPEYLDPETLSMLRETLDDAWDCLRPEQKATMHKTELAARIHDAAAEGERDRDVLISAALIGLVA